MGKRIDYVSLKQGFGLSRGLSEEFIRVCEAKDVPIEAIRRLVTPEGRGTMEALAERIFADWQAEQLASAEAMADRPQSSKFVEPEGAHPYRSSPSNGATKVIAVPDLSPVDLVALAQEKIGLTHSSPYLVTWDFCRYRVEEGRPAKYLEVRGKRYEVLTWKPGEYVTTQQVRNHFKDLGADGNTAAFIVWLMETKLVGQHVSIPSDDALLFRGAGSFLEAPYFYCDGAARELRLHFVDSNWYGRWVFVAFRAVSS